MRHKILKTSFAFSWHVLNYPVLIHYTTLQLLYHAYTEVCTYIIKTYTSLLSKCINCSIAFNMKCIYILLGNSSLNSVDEHLHNICKCSSTLLPVSELFTKSREWMSMVWTLLNLKKSCITLSIWFHLEEV